MKFPQTKTYFLIAALCAAVAACGGGDDESSPTTPTPTPAPATFADCFVITPGVAYTTTGDSAGKTLMVQETFEGTSRTGMAELSKATGNRETVNYWSPETSGVRFWGLIFYNSVDASANSRHVYSDGFLLPLNMQAGQSVTLNYTDTYTSLGDSTQQTSTQAYKETWAFEGFETVTLGGKTFENVCRVKMTFEEPAPEEGEGPSTVWFAKGFGPIHVRHVNSAGTVTSETKLETITAQP